MSLFGRGRQEILEDAFMNHMDKEEASFRKLIDTLDSIKEEIHKTNTHMSEIESTTALRILQTKTEILELTFDKLVSKHTYTKDVDDLEVVLTDINTKIEGKVSRKEVALLWGLFVTIMGSVAWTINLLIDLNLIG